ncbi:MAG TPA: TrkH family potassium uptake protein [Candidatus Gemmiger excrementavium]|uniref:TrkH family potassium uptake protein n=1 Tax=Candidatus Gemmiger excrementavium TaxID=2838608 RepID=A0A9D2JGD8_9FIRM|nr:TrkH family potassium uptake protein [Candidatus Gemmiger excrementavium]
MNYKMVGFVLGRIFFIEAVLMLCPALCAALYGEWNVVLAFAWPVLALVLLGLLLSRRTPRNTTIYARDGLVIAALVWVLMAAFGAMPFLISGEIPSVFDAFFEMVSGFTTTGSTILTDVESMSRGLLFWRSFAHWIGGMGVLVFAMAILPMTDGRAMHLMRAEVPGPTVGKISSKLRDSAKILYQIYFVLTVIEVVILCLGGMPLFDALIHSFGTAGTGGFSNKALSVGAYNNPFFEVVIGVFMLLFGINFNLYYFLLLRHFKEAFCSEELKVYLGIVAFSTLTITANIASLYDNVGTALRTAFFQVASIVTTTGYATADFNLWPNYARTVLVILTFIGACAGSTAGGLKVSRIIIFFKAARQDLNKMLHSHAVTTVRFEGKPLDEKTLRGVHNYFNIYMLIFALSVLFVSLDGFDPITTFTAVATCFNNVGPGLELVGPMGSFAEFSDLAKLLLSFDMLAGRLELYPMLALFSPRIWRRRGNAMHA